MVSAGSSLSVDRTRELTVTTPAHAAGAVDVVVTTPAGSSSAASFTYVTPGPAITDVSPTSGSTDGGTSVTITGTHFTGATSVTFDGVAGSSLSVTNDGELTVVTPAHVAGTADVVVLTPVWFSNTASFTYVTPAPAITDVSPTSGSTDGGTTVTITGTHFTGATSVTFDGVAGSSLSVTNDGELTVVTPAHAAGAVDVVVTTPVGSSGGHVHVRDSGPAITDVSPESGSTDGGTSVTITGTHFTGATSVTFDGSEGTSLSVTNDGELTVVTPAHAAGAVDVVVTTPAGSSSAASFTYVTPGPAITDVSPTSGSTDGGTSVTITGTHFTGATSVTFDGVAGSSLSVTNDGELTVVTPAHVAGTADVVVLTPVWFSNTASFTYVTPAPAITDVSPTSGSTDGGTTVTITGTHFTGATSVTFDGVAGSSLSVTNDGELTVVTPAHAAGAVDVVVTTPVGSSPARTFTFVAPAPTVVVEAPETYADGAAVTLDISVTPAISDGGELWYRTDGGSWRKAATTVSVVDGVGSKVVHPSGTREYKVVIGGAESNVVTLTPIVPDVTLSAPETYSPGSAVSLEFSVDPSMTASGELWYRTDGGSWRKAATTVSVSGGTGTKTVHPSGIREYKVVFGGAESNVVTLTPIVPDVTLSAPETYSPGSAVSLEFSVDPSMTACGRAVVSHGRGVVAQGRDDRVRVGRHRDQDGAPVRHPGVQGGLRRRRVQRRDVDADCSRRDAQRSGDLQPGQCGVVGVLGGSVDDGLG